MLDLGINCSLKKVAKPTKHFPKTLAWRNAHKRSATGRSVADLPLEVLKLQIQKLSKPDRSLACLSLSSSTSHSAKPTTKIVGFLILATEIQICFDYWPTFCSSKRHKKGRIQNPPKIIKIYPLGARGSDFD